MCRSVWQRRERERQRIGWPLFCRHLRRIQVFTHVTDVSLSPQVAAALQVRVAHLVTSHFSSVFLVLSCARPVAARFFILARNDSYIQAKNCTHLAVRATDAR